MSLVLTDGGIETMLVHRAVYVGTGVCYRESSVLGIRVDNVSCEIRLDTVLPLGQ